MTSLRRALWLLAFVGVVGGAVPMALAMGSDHLDNRALNVVFGPLIGWAFIGTGLFAWWRRPENRFGALMTAVGFTWCIAGLSVADEPGLFIAGLLLGALPYGFLVHMLLAFPRGVLEGRLATVVVSAGYFVTTIMQFTWALVYDTTREECGCPPNPLLAWDNQGVADFLYTAQSILAIVVIAGLIVALYRRWRGMSRVQRRGLTPVIFTGLVLAVDLAITLAADLSGVSGAAEEVIDIVGLSLLASVPFAFLAGLLSSRVSRAGAVGGLVTRLADAPRRGELRDALAEALDDDSLMLAYWLPDTASYVDARGHPVRIPAPGSGRGVSHVERDGRRVATIVYDASVAEDDPGLVDAIGSATALALENERLDAELCARVEELRGSRMRLMEVGMAERRGLERNLHDGAQQRLVSLALTLRAARTRLGGSEDGAGELLDRAELELELAISELRELARGIHPAVLSDRGLPAALESLAARSPVPVEVGVLPAERLPEPVELAAYYVISEALANVVKYAGATHATVDVARSNGDVLVEVGDDGVGGADPARGTGLRGLQDRVRALEGRLAVVSESGQGTRVKARIPCG